jgi:hypothetical protein
MVPSLSRGGHKEFGEGGRPRIAPYHTVRVVVHYGNFGGQCHKGSWPCQNAFKCGAERFGRGGIARSFFGLDYACIAVISGWTPMMFMTRVRL